VSLQTPSQGCFEPTLLRFSNPISFVPLGFTEDDLTVAPCENVETTPDYSKLM
jgi:hypothetical protein